jgi:hypothetical protein
MVILKNLILNWQVEKMSEFNSVIDFFSLFSLIYWTVHVDLIFSL